MGSTNFWELLLPRATPTFLLVGSDDKPWQTAAAVHTKFEVAGFIYYGHIREFVFKRQIRFLSHFFGGVRNNVRTSSIARWKARSDFLFAIIELFLLAFTVETL